MNDLYENIRAICKKRRIYIYELEEMAGLANNTLNRWGNTQPSIDKVKRVADALNVTIDELMGDKTQLLEDGTTFKGGNHVDEEKSFHGTYRAAGSVRGSDADE